MVFNVIQYIIYWVKVSSYVHFKLELNLADTYHRISHIKAIFTAETISWFCYTSLATFKTFEAFFIIICDIQKITIVTFSAENVIFAIHTVFQLTNGTFLYVSLINIIEKVPNFTSCAVIFVVFDTILCQTLVTWDIFALKILKELLLSASVL